MGGQMGKPFLTEGRGGTKAADRLISERKRISRQYPEPQVSDFGVPVCNLLAKHLSTLFSASKSTSLKWV